MIDDVTPHRLERRPKPRRIEPLEKPVQTPIHELAAAEDPDFQTPGQVAAHDLPAIAKSVVVHHQEPQRPWYKLSWPPTRKQLIIGGALLLVILLGLSGAWMLTHRKHTVAAVVHVKKAPPKKAPAPTIIYSTLTGLPVADASVNQRPVTGVMIENSIDARPQSGLGSAGVVFEAVAEGGVTRFLALFQDTTPTNVGPIRSARPYYIQWDMGFDAAYAHVGGSDDALADIPAWGTKDMNQFSNGSYYHRTTDRAAPHNVYTGIDTLNQLEAKKGYTSTYTGFPRKKEQPYKAPAAASTQTGSTKKVAPADTRTPATSIDFSLSGYTYDPHYDYSAVTNSYNRSEAGDPQMDANTNTQLSPKVVIAIVVPESRGALDSSGAFYSDYNVIGNGTAYIFQDGTLTTGQWSKASTTAQVAFTDASGNAIPLNPGQTWISAVTSVTGVKYK